MISLMTMPFSACMQIKPPRSPAANMRAEDRCVVDQKHTRVGHEHLETSDAFVHRGVHLFDLVVFQFSRDQVEAIVDRRLAFGFLVPVINAFD